MTTVVESEDVSVVAADREVYVAVVESDLTRIVSVGEAGPPGPPGSSSAHPDPHLLGDGSVGAPTYSFLSHSGTGVWRRDQVDTFLNHYEAIAFSANSVEVLTVFDQLGATGIIPGATDPLTSGGRPLLISGGTAPTSGIGGSVSIQVPISTEGDGQSLTLIAGEAGSISGTPYNGGGFVIASGRGKAGGRGGVIAATAGLGQGAGAGGSVSFTSGQGGSSGNGGDVTFTAVRGGGAGTTGGTITFRTIDATASNASSGSMAVILGNKTGTGTIGNVTFSVGVFSGNSPIARINGTTRHISHMGTTPTVTAGGGTSPGIVGRDEAFAVTIGTGGVDTSFEVTFANAFTNAPIVPMPCSDTDQTTFKVTSTASSVTVIAPSPFTVGSTVYVVCRGWE